jgi:hypothetical protein
MWSRFREIPEYIERQTKKTGTSPSITIAELEKKRESSEDLEGLGFNALAAGKKMGLNMLVQVLKKRRGDEAEKSKTATEPLVSLLYIYI